MGIIGEEFCKCAESTRDIENKNFLMCVAGNPVTVDFTQIVDYFGGLVVEETEDDGQWLIRYDENGVRSLVPYNVYDEHYLVDNEYLLGQPDSHPFRTRGNFPNQGVQDPIVIETAPPEGMNPTHAIISVSTTGKNVSMILYDDDNNPIFMRGNYGAYSSTVKQAKVPITKNESTGKYELVVNSQSSHGDGWNWYAIVLEGFATMDSVNSSGNIPDDPTSGSGSGGLESFDITYLKHTYDASGNDLTIVEWVKDPLQADQDMYHIEFDLGRGDITTAQVPHEAANSDLFQRVEVTWTTKHALRVDVRVGNGVEYSDSVESDSGTPQESINSIHVIPAI